MAEDGGSGRSRVPPAVKIPRARQAPASGRAAVLWPWPWLLRHRRRRRQAESAERAGPGEASPGAGPQPGADASCALCPGIPDTPNPARARCPARAWVLAGLGACCRHPRFPWLRWGWVQTCALSSAGRFWSSPGPGEDAWPGQEWLSGCHRASPRPPETLKSSEKSGRRLPSRIGVAAARGRRLGSCSCREMIFWNRLTN